MTAILGNLDRCADQIRTADGAWVPVPARYVGELMFEVGVTEFKDSETGVDRIKEFTVQAAHMVPKVWGADPTATDPKDMRKVPTSIVITGVGSVCGYEEWDNVLVRVTK